MIIESEQEDPVFDTEPYYRQGPLAEVDHQLPATWTAYLSMRQEIRDPQDLISTRRRGGDGQKEIIEYEPPNNPTVENFDDSLVPPAVIMEYEPPNNPTVERFDDSLVLPAIIMEYEPPNNPTAENFDYSLVLPAVRHKRPISALMEFLDIKAELQRPMSFLIDREYKSVIIRVFVELVCPGGQSKDMDRAIKRHAHDIFSRFSGPIPLSFKEKLDETVDDGMSVIDRAVSTFAQHMCCPLGKLAALLSDEQRASQREQVFHLSVISEIIHALRARLGRPHNDGVLKPESPYVDSVFPRVVLRWGCRSALIVYSRIKRELQRQVGELINREDNSNELWLFNYYGVCSGTSMEDAIRTSATKIFKRYFGRIPQWYKNMEAKRTDEMKEETDDETDDEIEGFNLNVSLYCEDICRQVEELLGLVSIDKTPQIEQLLRIACLLVYMHEETPYRWIFWAHLILNHLRHANHTAWAR
ncbi:hypothetical protein TRIUR3_13166 [Triticum urartu]|uniref:Uncharacterized protein n=1 Tax=Triticum urartu TaxID=4572 RepID=M8AZ36_TRIUA|nr:hypothetical protein TRIUR3_13166 [Triticum urartu]